MLRREFILDSAALTALVTGWRADMASGLLSDAPAGLRFGYAAITWGGNDLQAIDDISALGFPGIQLRASAVARWGDRPEELKALLASRGLTFVALSSGVAIADPARAAGNLALHERHARFLQAVGGLYLQVVDQRPHGRATSRADFVRMGRHLTEIGRRAADYGVHLGLHNHMGNLSQSPDEVAQVLDAADPRVVRLELDVAHYHQAGGDPAKAIREHGDRLLFLHIKDVESPVPGKEPGSYRFVELGKGQVDLASVFAALSAVRFDGWGVVELDDVPDNARSPRESGEVAKRFLESLKLQVGSHELSATRERG
jgi:inosose dehydratase